METPWSTSYSLFCPQANSTYVGVACQALKSQLLWPLLPNSLLSPSLLEHLPNQTKDHIPWSPAEPASEWSRAERSAPHVICTHGGLQSSCFKTSDAAVSPAGRGLPHSWKQLPCGSRPMAPYSFLSQSRLAAVSTALSTGHSWRTYALWGGTSQGPELSPSSLTKAASVHVK